MTRHERFYMVLLIIVLIGTQIMGVIGYNLGVDGRGVTYTGWAGYFIMVGFFSLVSMFGGILVLLFPTIHRWIKKGRQDEAGTRSEVTDRTLHQHFTAPITSIPTTVRGGSEDDVQSAVSGCPPITADQLTRRALRDHATSHVSG